MTPVTRRENALTLLKGSRMSLPRADLMTVSEVAQMMRVSNMTVYRLIKGGDLGAVRIGKNYRIRKNDVLSYLMRRSTRVGTLLLEER